MELRFDYSDGDYCFDMGGNMMVDSDGNFMQDIGGGVAMIWNLARCILLKAIAHLEALLMMKIKITYVYCRLRLC